jgi:threonyl-tRNA synthetase
MNSRPFSLSSLRSISSITVNHVVFLISQEKQPFERIEVSKDEALEMFSDNNFKVSKTV